MLFKTNHMFVSWWGRWHTANSFLDLSQSSSLEYRWTLLSSKRFWISQYILYRLLPHSYVVLDNICKRFWRWAFHNRFKNVWTRFPLPRSRQSKPTPSAQVWRHSSPICLQCVSSWIYGHLVWHCKGPFVLILHLATLSDTVLICENTSEMPLHIFLSSSSIFRDLLRYCTRFSGMDIASCQSHVYFYSGITGWRQFISDYTFYEGHRWRFVFKWLWLCVAISANFFIKTFTYFVKVH